MEALELHRTRSRQLALRETPNDEVAILSPDNNHSDSQNTDLSHESQLPPVDKGKDAWLFLASCFFIEALVWGEYTSLLSNLLSLSDAIFSLGFAFSFGIFQEYYSTHAPFAGSGNIAIIGTTATVSCSEHWTDFSLSVLTVGIRASSTSLPHSSLH